MGTFELNDDGLIGAFEMGAFEIQETLGLSFTAETVRVELNTRSSAVEDEFNMGAGPERIALPAGPYLRVAILDTQLNLEAGETSAALEGDFFFEQVRSHKAGDEWCDSRARD